MIHNIKDVEHLCMHGMRASKTATSLNSFATKRVVNDPAGIYRDFLFNMRDKTGFFMLTSFKLCPT